MIPLLDTSPYCGRGAGMILGLPFIPGWVRSSRRELGGLDRRLRPGTHERGLYTYAFS